MEYARNFLSKYQHLTPPQSSKVKMVVAAIRDECGIVLHERTITLHRGGICVSCHPTVRSELICCAPRILEKLHTEHNIRLAFIR